MNLQRVLPLGLFLLAPIAACGGATVDDLPGTGGAAGAGGGSAGSGTAGSGVAGKGGSGTAGSGTAGSGTAGSGTAGTGAAGSGMGGSSGQCKTANDCPVGPCEICPDGSQNCPSVSCINGQCLGSSSSCPSGPMCKTAADCPQPGAPCQVCADGSFSCPSVQCVGGTCQFDSGKACPPPSSCDPQNAFGVGMCFGFLGVKWNGSGCESLSGCSCQGSDCKALYETPEACLIAHNACPTTSPCGGKQCGDTCTNCKPGQPCPPFVEYCGANGDCGPAFPVCDGPPPSCEGASCGSPCTVPCDFPGCTATKGVCNAAGQCSTGSPVCAMASCKPMNAKGQGACDALLGVTWNGTQCVAIGGCSCVGTDCGKLYQSIGDCLDAQSACACQGKTCGSFCTCPGGDCVKQPYYCTSDFSGSCQPGPIACPL